jgi:hypothetical protein
VKTSRTFYRLTLASFNDVPGHMNISAEPGWENTNAQMLRVRSKRTHARDTVVCRCVDVRVLPEKTSGRRAYS